MTELEIAGLGVWSARFSNWSDFVLGINTGEWQTDVGLQPDLIAPRERRRAPQLVKMAVEVMSQACKMASLQPDSVATVFSSAMGDMQITDYMCEGLAKTPKFISPTRFHNSVHNAAPGYWSIATGSFSPANAVSAFRYSSPMAFLEASIQVAEEKTPVVVVTQEIAAPVALADTCPSKHPFSAAFLLAPVGYSAAPVSEIQIAVSQEARDWPQLPESLCADFASNMSASLLPLLSEIASNHGDADDSMLRFPLSPFASLDISLMSPVMTGAGDA